MKKSMGLRFLFVVLALTLLSSPFCSSSPPYYLSKDSSLSVEKTSDVLISKNSVFSAGFYKVGTNAFCFSIWFTEKNDTIVWMANRDNPVNGRRSKLTLLNSGNLILKDAGENTVWSAHTDSKKSSEPMKLQLEDTGNLVLHYFLQGKHRVVWQSFDSPTDTLLPQQRLTESNALVSSRSKTNHSSGLYTLLFSDNNILRLVFNGIEESSVYWPDTSNTSFPWEVGRSSYDNSRTAELKRSGYFQSSDRLKFSSADFGLGPQRILILNYDGNIRVYSLETLENNKKNWEVQWQAISEPCTIHGACGSNSLCHIEFGRRCSCLPGYKLKNHTDWSYGCEPDFANCEDADKAGFIKLQHIEFDGHDSGKFENYTLDECKEECLKQCSCLAFQFKFDSGKGFYSCYTKSKLLNGFRSVSFDDPIYVKLPKNVLNSSEKLLQGSNLNCSKKGYLEVQLDRNYKKKSENQSVKFILWFIIAFGGFEMICIIFLNYKSKPLSHTNSTMQRYHEVATGFTRFTYTELKKASRNFSQEIGRGGGGVVYKAVLSDQRIAAIKVLNEANHGEEEFLAEMSTIGRLNHMNLIEIWGYCAERKHRLLVYEYMKNGSLAEKLNSNTLDWVKRYDIALGTAKGLAYLHEECLEWVLHCDIKPQNILLDSNYVPKVADFGLSKLLNRGGIGNSSFSHIRGTRGYMAPEWVFNLSITSKVDVYSYGIVILELITGRSPTGETDNPRLVNWVREKKNVATRSGRGLWIEDIVDPTVNGDYNTGRMEVLVQVAMQCAEADKAARPTMSQVVDMLLHEENGD